MLFAAAAVVFVLSIVVYVLIMIFFPEWVGITGKVALNNEKSHRGDLPADSSEESAQGVAREADSQSNHSND